MEKNDASDKSQLPLLHSVRSDMVESDRDLNMAMCAPVAATLKCLPRCSASTPISSGQGFPLVRTLHFSRRIRKCPKGGFSVLVTSFCGRAWNWSIIAQNQTITLIYNISIPILFHFPHMPINSTLTRFYHSQNTRGNLQ